MESTLAGNGRTTETSPRQQELSNLIADVQDLLGRVGHLADPEIALLRTRVEHGIAATRQTLADGAAKVQSGARQALDSGDGYVRDQPWQAVGIAAAAGLVVGFLVARR
jgi:X-X-X-Leu-X-X-Gly heptad repeat protein